ncbi:MAG: AAA family ATPase, partial [Candidatus Nanopelagicales bacterium]
MTNTQGEGMDPAGVTESAAMALPLGGIGGILAARHADVGHSREKQRRRRLRSLALTLGIPALFLWYRILSGNPFTPSFPSIDPFLLVPIIFFAALLAVLIGTTAGAGRSPHVTYRPEQISIKLDDVKGIDAVKEDVVRSLNLFLAHKTFSQEMGGTPRRGLLFEGAPGTGKTFLAKAMAREAGVPFLFVSATSFQSMYYGATARKIRSYFKQLRKVARQE